MADRIAPGAVESFYSAASVGLRALDGRSSGRRTFGSEADARWQGFKGHLRTSDRLDLALRDVAVTWGAAFSAALVFQLAGLAPDEPFGPDWPGLVEDHARRVWREAAALELGGWADDLARVSSAWNLPPAAAPALGAVAPATKLLVAGTAAILTAARVFGAGESLSWADQVVVVASRAGGLIEEWTEYLTHHSAFGSDSTFRDTLRRRLNNLLDRGLVARKGTMYSITDAGLSYLKRVGTEEALGGDEQQQLWTLVKKQQTAVRESMRELLLDMDPFAFEHLIKRLLEEMDYQNVQVTSRSGDGGVDVVADIELGITSVREVVQAKRHKRTIQRKDLDALRGSLYRFNAVRGTIIATAPFSKGTSEAAFATGAAPITLIDGDKLIDLLIEHGIGVKKNKIEVLSVDADAFADLEPEA